MREEMSSEERIVTQKTTWGQQILLLIENIAKSCKLTNFPFNVYSEIDTVSSITISNFTISTSFVWMDKNVVKAVSVSL